MKKWIIILCTLTTLVSCDHLRRWFGNEPERVAQIGKQILYKNQVEGLLKNAPSASDSINLVNHYIDLWAIDNLLLKKAEVELTKEEKDVEQELADYRKSLLVFRYQKKYVEQRIDTLIEAEEILSYYNNNQELFLLDSPLFKLRLIKMRLHSPYLPMVRNIYRSKTMEDLTQLELLCESSAEIYTDYAGKWITSQELAQDLPDGNMDRIQALRTEGFIDTRDSLYAYLVRVDDFVPARKPAPIEQTEAGIRQIILSKRKQQLLKDLETEVLQEGWNKQIIKIYRKDED
ncbi:MAG: hypothetical protein PHT64_02245 [Bacteroidales bacterium]|nr:hypothetical protein [Bacteroidales bacterium]MDD4030774.1 hypothetical protein [Bacteroidales bacterium]MDD4435832.1 hypothetical protein [Bacteroidales bacterium]MDD5732602.1 hypothetical protein [Bacteroidales bacterium]